MIVAVGIADPPIETLGVLADDNEIGVGVEDLQPGRGNRFQPFTHGKVEHAGICGAHLGLGHRRHR